MPLLVSSLLGDQVKLKGLVRVIPMPSSVLVPIPPYIAHSMAFAQGLEDRDIFDPFGVKNKLISSLLFLNFVLFISFVFVFGESPLLIYF
jgi:hypothetical protein